MLRSQALGVGIVLCVAAACTAFGQEETAPDPRSDAPPIPFGPGDSFAVNQVEVLKDFVPPFMWEYRDRFFYEGMRLEIGRCSTRSAF
jgi:hypothetical protein